MFNAKNIFESIKDHLIIKYKPIDDIELIKNQSDYTIKFFNTPAIKVKNGIKDYIYIKSTYKGKFKTHVEFEEVKHMANWLRFKVTSEEQIYTLLHAVSDMYDDIYDFTPV